jgi:hypothetical protein
MMAAVVAAALHERIVATLFLAIAGVLLLTPRFSSGKRVRQRSRIERKDAIRSVTQPKGAMLVEGETP